MLQPDTDIFLRLPTDESHSALHPAKLLSSHEGACTAQLEEATIAVEPGQELSLYYQVRGKFVQQAIRITAVLKSSPPLVIAFITTADAVSANSRECFRVSTTIAGLTADVGEEHACPVNDVSAIGFSFISKTVYRIGAQLPVVMSHAGRTFRGVACIQSIRSLDRGRLRYGMFCLGDPREGTANLNKGLAILSAEFQRAQLQRLAGGAGA